MREGEGAWWAPGECGGCVLVAAVREGPLGRLFEGAPSPCPQPAWGRLVLVPHWQRNVA